MKGGKVGCRWMKQESADETNGLQISIFQPSFLQQNY